MNEYIGLIFGCPSKSCHDSCPFKSFWEMNPENAFKSWDKLTVDQKHNLIELHRKCPYSCKKYFNLDKIRLLGT